MADERFTALPTAEEYTLFREAYAETYPVRPLLNAIGAKDAEIERLKEDLARWAFKAGSAAGTLAMERDTCLKRLAENDEEIMRLRSVALAARALVQSAHACLASDDPEHDETSVSEPELVALESALEAAGYGMSEEEMADG